MMRPALLCSLLLRRNCNGPSPAARGDEQPRPRFLWVSSGSRCAGRLGLTSTAHGVRSVRSEPPTLRGEQGRQLRSPCTRL